MSLFGYICRLLLTETNRGRRPAMAAPAPLTENGACATMSCSSVVENNNVVLSTPYFNGNVVVNFLFANAHTNGSIVKNMSKNAWAVSSLVTKYLSAELIDYSVVGLVVYDGCVFTKLEDSGSSFTHQKRVVFEVNNANVVDFISSLELRQVHATLVSSLIFKQLNISVTLHGVLTTSGGRNLTFELIRAQRSSEYNDFLNCVGSYSEVFDRARGFTPLPVLIRHRLDHPELYVKTVVVEALDGWFSLNLKPSDEQLQTALESIGASRIGESLAGATEKMDTLFSTLLKFFPSVETVNFIKDQGLNFLIFVFEICEAILAHDIGLNSVLRFGLKAMGIFGIPFELMSNITLQVTKMFNSARTMVSLGASEVVTQAGDDSIGSIIAAMVGVFVSGTCLDERGIKKAGDYSRTFNTLVQSTSKVESLFKGFLEWLPNVLKGYIDMFFPGICVSKTSEMRKKLKSCVDDMNLTLDAVRLDATVVHSTPFQQRAFAVEQMVRGVLEEADDFQRDASMRSLTMRCIKLEEKFRTLAGELRTLSKEKDGRPTPYCLTFYGEAGVGKSTVAGAMAYRFAPECPDGNRVYARNATDDFWSGYRQQPVVLLDDLGQETSKCVDLLETFSMISTATFMPPMASLENVGIGVKGTKFTSPLIIACTNNPWPKPVNVYKQEALYRRRNILCEVVVSQDTRRRGGGVPDPEAMEGDFSHISFICRDPMDASGRGPQGGKSMTYEEFCAYFVNDFNKHHAREKGLYDSCKKGIRTPLVVAEGLVENFLLKFCKEPKIDPATLKEMGLLMKKKRNAADYKKVVLSLFSNFQCGSPKVFPDKYTARLITYSGLTEHERAVLYRFFDSIPLTAFELFVEYEAASCFEEFYENIGLFMNAIVYYTFDALCQFYVAYEHKESDDIIARILEEEGDLSVAIMEMSHRKKTFYEKHPILTKILMACVDVTVIGGLIYVSSLIIGKLFFPTSEKKAVVQSFERSTRDVFSSKRKTAQIGKPKHVISKAQSLVDTVVGINEKDFENLVEVFVTNGIKKMDAEQKARHLLDFCLIAKSQLGSEAIGRCRRGPDMDELYQTLAQGLDNQKMHQVAHQMRNLVGTEVVVQGLVCDILGGATKKDLDCISHLVSLGYDQEAVTDAVSLLVPVSDMVVEMTKRMSASGKARVQAEIKNLVSELFINEPAILALADGSLSDERYSGERLVVYSDHCSAILQGGDDVAAYDLIDNKVLPQMLCITRIVGGRFTRMGCFAMGGKDLIVPHHFFVNQETGNYIPDGSIMSFEGADKYRVEEEIFYKARLRQLRFNGGGIDVCVYRCSGRLRSFGKALHLFIVDDDLKHISATTASLVACRNNLPTVQLLNMMISNDAVMTEGAASFLTPKSWRYSAPTGAGMCGGLLIAHKNTLQRKFCGMHFAASRTDPLSYGQILTQELLSAAVDSLNADFGEPVHGDMVFRDLEPLSESRLVLEGDFSLYGTVEKGEEVRCPIKTRLEKSILFESVFPTMRGPAPLIPSDPRIKGEFRGKSMLASAISKYGKMSRPFDEILVDECVDDVFDEINAVHTNVPRREATMDEAINGNIYIECAERLNLKTSAGYPWTLKKEHGSKGKACWFEGDDLVRTMKPDLAMAVEERIELARRGERSPSIWTDNLKDELINIEKIENGKTRTFSIAPMDYTIVFRKFMLFFCAHFMSVKLSTFSAIGINAESRDWTQLMRTLKEKSPIGIAGDYSRWDGVMSAQIMEKVAERIVNRWYNMGSVDESANLARRVLVDEMIHTPVLAMNLMYGQHGGNPSGNPMTAIINTIVNAVYMRYVYAKIMPLDQSSMIDFHRNVKMFIYGDDNIIAIRPEIRSFFNMQTVSREFAKLGITYTTADKQNAEEALPYDTLENLSFLKRGFRPVSNEYYPLMSMKTIRDLVNWIRECDDPEEACIENCNTALRFLFFYGEQDFKAFRDSVMNRFHALGINAHLHSFGYLRRYYSEHHGFPVTTEDFEVKTVVVLEMEEGNLDGGIVLPSVAGLNVGASNDGKAPLKTGQSHSKQSACDPPWSVTESASKWVFVSTVQWPTSAAAGATLFGGFWNVPFDLLKSAQTIYPFTQFLQWRGGVHLRFSVDGTPFHQGMVRVLWIPLAGPTNFPLGISGTTQDSQFTHVKIFANTSEDVELFIPFVHPRDFLSLSDASSGSWLYNTLGQIGIVVCNPLNVASGSSTSVPISVYASFSEDSRFVVPASRTLTGARGAGEMRLPHEITGFRGTRGKHCEVVLESMSGIVGTLMAPIIEKVLPKNVIGDAIHALGFGGMDKPNNTLQPSYMIPRQMGYLSNSTQIEQIERLSYVPSFNDEAEPDDFQIGQDETDLDWLLAKKTLVNVVNWSVSDLSGAILWTRRIEAFADMYNIIASAENAQVPVSLLGHLTALHERWRGPIDFEIEFVATDFHRGKLFFGVHYGVTVAPVDFASAVNQFGIYIDLVPGKRSYTVTVEYNTYSKWLYVGNGRNFDAVATADRSGMGILSLRVVNPLVTSVSVPNSIQFNVYVGGGVGFQLADPGLSNSSLFPIILQAEEGNESMEEPIIGLKKPENKKPISQQAKTEVNLGRGCVIEPRKINSRGKGGHTCNNLIDILKKYHPISPSLQMVRVFDEENYAAMIQLHWGAMVWGMFTQPSGDPNYVPWYANTNVTWNKITSMYRFARGSLRFKVLVYDASDATRKVSAWAFHYQRMNEPIINEAAVSQLLTTTNVVPWGTYTSGAIRYVGSGNAAVSYGTGSPAILEFEIPWTSIYNFAICPQNVSYNAIADSSMFGPGTIHIGAGVENGGGATDTLETQIWIAAGDDFHLSGFIGTPNLVRGFNFDDGVKKYAWPDSYYV